MRPNPVSFSSAFRDAFGQAIGATKQCLPAMLALEFAMAALVAIYYGWPPATALLSRFGDWMHAGGVLYAALGTAIAGGLLSEVSLVYIQNHGRWTKRNLENAAFKFAIFFFNGSVVYEFYQMQAVWWGEGPALSVVVPKILVDQFVFSVFWSTSYQTILTRWQTLRYSFTKLYQELNWHFVTGRMLPMLIMNWLFWVPGVCLIYSLPTDLESPLFLFALAIWGLLLPAVARQKLASEHATLQSLVVPEVEVVPNPAE